MYRRLSYSFHCSIVPEHVNKPHLKNCQFYSVAFYVNIHVPQMTGTSSKLSI